jgi:hypothetical protein
MTLLPRGLVAVDVGDDDAAGGGHDKNHSSPEELRRRRLDGIRMLAGRKISCAWNRGSQRYWFGPILRCFKLDFFGEALQESEIYL